MSPKVMIESTIEYSVILSQIGAVKEDLDKFCQAMYEAPQGVIVQVPPWLSTQKSNELCSVIRQIKENYERQGGTVDIKKVAEIRGSRFNTGKLRMDLIDPLAMEGLAAVLTYGAQKYADHNWRQGLPVMETLASLLRHTASFMKGEDIDPESGLPHVDHMQFGTMVLSNMMKTRPDMDDRWKPKEDKSEFDWYKWVQTPVQDTPKSGSS